MVIQRTTNVNLGLINTSKIYSITSAETLWKIESGNRAVEVINIGTGTVYYGQSSFTTGSGGIITSLCSKFWDHVVGNFELSFKTVSAASVPIVIHEYA